MKTKLTTVFHLFRKHAFLFFLGFLSLLFIFGLALNSITPPIPPNQPNEWLGQVPGYKLSPKALEEKFGKPLSKNVQSSGIQYEYQSDYPLFPHEVITNSQDIVLFIKEKIPSESDENISQYKEKWGDSPLELYIHDELAYKAHVYLEQGVVVVAHQVDGGVLEKWYFTPTSEDIFLRSWGAELEEELESHPHPLIEPVN